MRARRGLRLCGDGLVGGGPGRFDSPGPSAGLWGGRGQAEPLADVDQAAPVLATEGQHPDRELALPDQAVRFVPADVQAAGGCLDVHRRGERQYLIDRQRPAPACGMPVRRVGDPTRRCFWTVSHDATGKRCRDRGRLGMDWLGTLTSLSNRYSTLIFGSPSAAAISAAVSAVHAFPPETSCEMNDSCTPAEQAISRCVSPRSRRIRVNLTLNIRMDTSATLRRCLIRHSQCPEFSKANWVTVDMTTVKLSLTNVQRIAAVQRDKRPTGLS